MVGVKVYGRSPSMLREMRKSIRDVSRAAHFWPGGLIGRKICWAKPLINQPWRLSSRLFNHRDVGLG